MNREAVLEKNQTFNNFQNVTNTIKNAFVISSYQETEVEEDFTLEYQSFLSLFNMSLKMYSDAYYKEAAYLTHLDIDQIKLTLKNYKTNNNEVSRLVEDLVADLTDFQKRINNNYVEKINEIKKQKQSFEQQLRGLEVEKHKLIMDRLSRISWPYDSTTKSYDIKMNVLQRKVEQYTQKLSEAKHMQPIADKHEIRVYQQELKEKFGI